MTNSQLAVRGSQVPRLYLKPKSNRSDGGDAAALAAGYGLVLDPWQRLILDDWLAIAPDGRRAASTCWLSVPRQNGKTGITEAYALFALAVLGERILYTAQELPGAKRFFMSLMRWFGRKHNEPGAEFPELNALVERISHTNGREGIYLTNGGRIEFSSRTGKVFRGGSIDALILDEAQLHTDEYHEALGPALRASPDAQKIYLGTPPDTANAAGPFARIRKSLVSGTGERLAAAEWSPAPGENTYSLNAAVQSNPALGIRVSWADMQESAANGEYSEAGYARELLGAWSNGAVASRVIPQDAWSNQASTRSVPVSNLTLAFEVAPDQVSVAVALAGQRADGNWHVELYDQKDGVDWFVPTVKEVLRLNPQIAGVIADAGSPSRVLFPALREAGIQITEPRVQDLGIACSSYLSGLVTGSVFHTGQPQVNAAIQMAGKRPLGNTGMWVWSRKNTSSDITPIQAQTLALWGAQNSTSKHSKVLAPERKQRRITVLT